MNEVEQKGLLWRLGIGVDKVNKGSCAGYTWIGTGVEKDIRPDDILKSINPTNEQVIARVEKANSHFYETVVDRAVRGFKKWRTVPMPARGQMVRTICEEVREKKEDLGALISLEMGKILPEGLGEVQEIIDIGDVALGLSRQVCGGLLPSEREQHIMLERWHPLGLVGVVTAFNFPMAVWAWNAFIAAVCGDTIIWKPSSETPLCAIALQNICAKVMEQYGYNHVFNLVIGDGATMGEWLINDRRVPLISVTGSCETCWHTAEAVVKRKGPPPIPEGGGNNAVIVMDDADLNLALRAVIFGAIGTAGQRCTTTRRLFLHRGIADGFIDLLKAIYRQVLPRIGNPLDPNTSMGPLVNEQARRNMRIAQGHIIRDGGQVLFGGNTALKSPGFFVEPMLVRIKHDAPIVRQETFAPILYINVFNALDEAIVWNNEVDQGLSSSLFTTNHKYGWRWLSEEGSDCGIANINVGTSGAEVGGAFGGNKHTGWGREAGSDAWKAYMRRTTATINYSDGLPLAQGIDFRIAN